VPVPAQIGVVHWHNHQVTEAGHDVLVTAGAEVVLGRLEGVDAANLEVLVRTYLGIRAHSTRSNVIATAAATST